MALVAAVVGPQTQPLLGFLVGGFVLLVIGLVILTRRRGDVAPLASPAGTRRALLGVLVYGLISSSFARIVAPALLAREQSPWLLALGDVLFVTMGLFVWVLVLAEGRPWSSYGFHGAAPARMALTLALGVGAAVVISWRAFAEVFTHEVQVVPDSLVFALLYSAIGSALPEELLFRGSLQGSMNGRANRWARLALPALVFTAVRAFRFVPGFEMPVGDWLFYVLGIVLPLGLWWGLMRDLAGGSLWPSLVSHALLEFGVGLAGASPTAAPLAP